MIAARIAFISGLLKDSACALALGHVWCDFAILEAIMFYEPSSKAVELKGLPLSDYMSPGYPKVDSTLSTAGIVVLADTEFAISTTGYRVYSSVITSKCSPVRRGPQKLMFKCSHGPARSSDMFRGTMGVGSAYVDWQARRFLTAF